MKPISKILLLIFIVSKVIIIVLLAVIGGCNEKNDSTSGANPVFPVKLVDAPAGYDAVNVEILRMEANMGSDWVELQVENPGMENTC